MKTNFKALKVNDKLSETSYYSVVKIAGEKVQLKNGLGQDIVVDKGYVENCLISGEQFDKEEKITKTELAKLFIENPNVVCTISFNKQVKATDVTKEILDAYSESTPKQLEATIKKVVNKALNGEERVLVGYHTGVQDDFGRVSAVDMNIEKDPKKEYNTALRLVDPRGINWLTLRGTKYTVK